MIILICIAFQAIISSQVLVEAKWHSSTNELAQLEAETAMIMTLLDLPATDMGKRKNNNNQNNQQPKKTKSDSAEGNGRAGMEKQKPTMTDYFAIALKIMPYLIAA